MKNQKEIVAESVDETSHLLNCEEGQTKRVENKIFESEHDRSRRNLTKTLSICFTLAIFVSYSVSFVRPPVKLKEQKHHLYEKKGHHDHTIPSLLSIRKRKDGTYANSAKNKLYERMKVSDFVLEGLDVGTHGTESRLLKKHAKDTVVQLAVIDTDGPSLSLSADPIVGVAFHDQLQVSWSGGTGEHAIEINDHDVLAMYCPANESDPRKFRDAATIKEARATTQWVLQEKVDLDTLIIEAFPIVREETCEFRLYTRETITADDIESYVGISAEEQERSYRFTLAAATGAFTLKDAMYAPTSLHLAFAHDQSEMVAHFNTGAEGTPIVRYGTSKKHLTSIATGSSTTYTASDLCQAPANLEEPGKFTHPGQLHSVTMKGLEPDTKYHYMVGIQSEKSNQMLWSDIQQFQTAPVVGSSEEPFSYVVYADQGGPGYGMSKGADRVTRRMITEMKENNIRSVHHFGDLSYSNGAAHMWDTWSDMVSKFAATIPLMIGVGNHEYDHTDGGGAGRDPSGVTTPWGYLPEWGNFGTDSRGECGIPVSNRFVMPQSEGSNGVYWYSFDYGTVHTVMISSEHDMSQGSEQYAWLENDLKNVDRTVTPWVIVESHRPLYNSADVPDNNRVGIAMRDQIEDLMYETDVDLVLSGHYHAYLRTCDGLYKSQCNNGGPMHITVGSAGAELDTVGLYDQEWTSFYSREWGYGRITVANETALHWEFVADENGLVRDELWIMKES